MQTFIELLKVIFLGFLQGFTEPLPISSSGHLVIVQALMKLPTVDYFFEIWVNFASLIAILVLFRKKIFTLMNGVWQYIMKRDVEYQPQFRYVLMIVVGVIPAGLAGLFFKDFFEGFLTLLAVGISLWFTGSFLLLVQRQSVENTKTDIGLIDALLVGSFQIFALLPGISRSGSTLVGGLIRKIQFKAVIEFSFLLYIPISIGTMVMAAFSVESYSGLNFWFLGSAFIASGLMTYFAFKWFLTMVKQGNLKYFAYYCFAVGTLSIVLSFFL